jgi:hypothetical protein
MNTKQIVIFYDDIEFPLVSDSGNLWNRLPFHEDFPSLLEYD